MFRRHFLNVRLLLTISLTCNVIQAATRPEQQQDTLVIPQIELINQRLHEGWKDYDLVPSAPATDFEFCRRVFLDVVGRIPTVSELYEFRADRSGNKKKNLVTRLLHDEKYR